MLSQNNSQWKLKTINGTASKIGDYGCLITDITDILVEAGYNITPDVLASDGDLFSGDLWKGWQTVCIKYPRLKYEWGAIYYDVPAPIEKIREALEKGWCPIIMIDCTPATAKVDTHYLRVKKIDAEGNLTVGDPWDGKDVLLDTRYGSATESRKILKIDVYSFTPEVISGSSVTLSPEMKNIVKYLNEEKIVVGETTRPVTEGDVRAGIGYVKDGAVSRLESQVLELSTKLDATSKALDAEKVAREQDKVDYGLGVADIEKKCQTKLDTLQEKYDNLAKLPSRIEDFDDKKVINRAVTIIINKILRRKENDTGTIKQ
jgi:hypothetical protein